MWKEFLSDQNLFPQISQMSFTMTVTGLAWIPHKLAFQTFPQCKLQLHVVLQELPKLVMNGKMTRIGQLWYQWQYAPIFYIPELLFAYRAQKEQKLKKLFFCKNAQHSMQYTNVFDPPSLHQSDHEKYHSKWEKVRAMLWHQLVTAMSRLSALEAY